MDGDGRYIRCIRSVEIAPLSIMSCAAPSSILDPLYEQAHLLSNVLIQCKSYQRNFLFSAKIRSISNHGPKSFLNILINLLDEPRLQKLCLLHKQCLSLMRTTNPRSI